MSASVTYAVMSEKVFSVTSTPPNLSASDTTPSRIDSQARTRRRPVRAIAAEPDDFRRSAANVEEDDRLRLTVGKLADARRGQMRFRLPIDNLERDAKLLAHLIDECGSVGGRAACFGGDGARSRDAPRRHLVAANAERPERSLDRRFAEAPGQRQALAEPDNA